MLRCDTHSTMRCSRWLARYIKYFFQIKPRCGAKRNKWYSAQTIANSLGLEENAKQNWAIGVHRVGSAQNSYGVWKRDTGVTGPP